MRDISYLMNERLKSEEQTPSNNANPKMSIQISRARSTIMDSDYWTVETIREKPGLGDISVASRRFKPYGRPNRIYEIHVDNGTVATAIREYPDTFKEGWKDQFEIGPGAFVAIAFDGSWNRYKNLWRLVTDESPYLFWVDSENILWTQVWDDESTRFQLASNVLQVDAIRAWKNQYYPELDQGIVAGYVKRDGSVWYRNYCEQEDGNTVWENEKQLEQVTSAKRVNLFLTNDYRMGFCIEKTNEEIKWLLTQRNWSGMAVVPESIATTMSIGKAELIPLRYKDFLPAELIDTSIGIRRINLCTMTDISGFSPNVIRAKRVDDFVIEIEYDVELYEVPNCYLSFSIMNNEIVAVSKKTSSTIQLLTKSLLKSIGSWTVEYDGQGGISSKRSQYCALDLNSFTTLATGEPPSAHEALQPTINLQGVNFIKLSFSNYNYPGERITAGFSIASIEFIKVGQNPL